MKVKAFRDEIVSVKPAEHVTAGHGDTSEFTCKLNGKDISHICVEADRPEGWADVIILCEGRPLLDQEGEPIIARVQGEIEITRTQRRKRVKI